MGFIDAAIWVGLVIALSTAAGLAWLFVVLWLARLLPRVRRVFGGPWAAWHAPGIRTRGNRRRTGLFLEPARIAAEWSRVTADCMVRSGDAVWFASCVARPDGTFAVDFPDHFTPVGPATPQTPGAARYRVQWTVRSEGRVLSAGDSFLLDDNGEPVPDRRSRSENDYVRRAHGRRRA